MMGNRDSGDLRVTLAAIDCQMMELTIIYSVAIL